MTNVRERLAAHGWPVPEARLPAGAYAPVHVDGDVVHTSGVIGWRDGQPAVVGRLGDDVDLAAGQEAARLACLQSLANLEATIGSLDRVAAVLKLSGFVRSTEDFEDLPPVLDGASEVLLAGFGEAGRSARTTVGVSALPKRGAVEVDLVVRLGAAS